MLEMRMPGARYWPRVNPASLMSQLELTRVVPSEKSCRGVPLARRAAARDGSSCGLRKTLPAER